jgi:choline dehydrogenase-like flavoprotein
MGDPEAASTQDLLAQAADPDRTPFDYVIVGCGAGGGPLAARLARAGKRVLVLEAGADVANRNAQCGALDPAAAAEAKLREAYEVPVYYAAASETKPMAWEFSVRHFADTQEQRQDPKYSPEHDPSQQGGVGKGGIFYPRASGVGGCTTHHAMIIVKPNDLDWERVADLTGDDSWRAASMQGYFALIEKVLYYRAYQSAFRKTLGQIAAWWRRVVAYLNPSDVLDNGGHGSAGWQKTSFISPALMTGPSSGCCSAPSSGSSSATATGGAS